MEIYGVPKHNSNNNNNNNNNNKLILNQKLRKQVLRQYITKKCAVPRRRTFAIVNMIIVLITPITLIKLFCFLLCFVLCICRTTLYTLFCILQLILSTAITLFGQHLTQHHHYTHEIPITHQQWQKVPELNQSWISTLSLKYLPSIEPQVMKSNSSCLRRNDRIMWYYKAHHQQNFCWHR
jgi:hypothetical protein